MIVEIPSKIKFLTHTYDVKFAPKYLISAQSCGLTRHLHQEILLDNLTLPESELPQIFLHEYIHVLERHLSIKLDDNDVDRLSEGLAVLLFDNLGIQFGWSNIKEG